MYFDYINWKNGEIATSSLCDVQIHTQQNCAAVLQRRWSPNEVIFSHVTALELLGIEVPLLRTKEFLATEVGTMQQNSSSRRQLSLDTELLHACVPLQYRRSDLEGIKFHVWKHDYEAVTGPGLLRCVSPIVAWKQLAAYTSVTELTVLADSMMRRNPRLKKAIPQDFSSALSPEERFVGKSKCAQALTMMRENTDSSQETRLRLLLEEQGLRNGIVNYEIWIDPHRKVHVDLAFPVLHLIIEYDGKYHDDPRQRKLDADLRQQLRDLGWTVVGVRSKDLKTEESREQLFKRIFSEINIPVTPTTSEI